MYSSVIFYPHLFCEGSRKQPKYFPAQTPSYGKCPMVSCPPATVHLRPPTVHLFLAMPPTDSPHRSSYAPSKLPPMSSYAPLQLSTTGVPGSYRRRHRLTLLPLWRGCLQDTYVPTGARTYMSQLDYRRISPRTVHTTIPHT